MTAPEITHPGGAGTLLTSARRVTHALRRRASRFRVALLVFILLMPLLLTMFLGEGR